MHGQISSMGESIELAQTANNHKLKTPSKSLEKQGKKLWEPLAEEEEQSCFSGPGAILHAQGAKGRRSALFPRLNITATAKKLGVTKSHLAKVLAGVNRPSIELAIRLAEVLGTDINVVVNLYKSKPEAPVAKLKKSTRKRKQNA